MRIYLGEIENSQKSMTVFLCLDEKHDKGIKDEKVFLRLKDFDQKWIKNILDSTIQKQGENSVVILDIYNQYYMQLYLLFSLRRRLYYLDIIKIMNIGYTSENLLYHKDVQGYLWNQLLLFMEENGYHFKIIKSEPSLYQERPLVPVNNFCRSEFFCRAGIRMLCQITRRLTIRYGLYLYYDFCGRLQKKMIQRILSKEYKNVKNIKSNSQSGCLFFSAFNKQKKKVFIKIGAVRGADIENEYNICRYMNKKLQDNDLYLLPYMTESSTNRLVFPYMNGCSLKNVLEQRALTEDEVNKLIVFLDLVVKDLRKCKIIHRDIHFDNILCDLDNETGKIVKFLLSDFGCAVVYNNKLLNKTIRQKRKNEYAGSIYRYSKYMWDDAAAAAYILMQNIDVQTFDKQIENRFLNHIGKMVYVLE